MDLLQEDGKAGAFLDHNKNLKKDDVRQTKRGLQRFFLFLVVKNVENNSKEIPMNRCTFSIKRMITKFDEPALCLCENGRRGRKFENRKKKL